MKRYPTEVRGIDTEEEAKLPVSSSAAPLFSDEQIQCYQSALRSLNEAGISYAVAGAFALHEHCGIWRTTKDLDIVLESKHVPAALDYLKKKGFYTFVKDPVWLAKAYLGDFFVDLITSLGNAVLCVDSSWMEHAKPIMLFGVPCKVLGVEEVIASKLFVTRRERFDGADIVHLIHSKAEQLNWDRIERLMKGHEELIFWSLVFFAYIYPKRTNAIPPEVWKRMMQRFESELKNPREGAPFRGTLIDPNMFAIDVAEWGERDLFQEYCSRASLIEASTENPTEE